MLEKVVLIIIGVLISGVGYLIKRFIEKKSESEVLEKHKKLLEINKQMIEQQVTVEDLRKLEAALTGKAEAIATYTKSIESEVTPLLEVKDGILMTQAEMNIVASSNFEATKERMNLIFNEIISELDGEEKNALLQSQRAWESYCLEQAEAAAISYQRGTIYPVIFFSEMESITVERAARLQVELDHLRRLREPKKGQPLIADNSSV